MPFGELQVQLKVGTFESKEDIRKELNSMARMISRTDAVHSVTVIDGPDVQYTDGEAE